MVRETLSEFVQRPTQVIARLDEGDVLLTRREEEDLVLRRAADARLDYEIVSGALGMMSSVLREHLVPSTSLKYVVSAFPWLGLLPDAAVEQFSENFIRLALAGASIANFNSLRSMLSSWEDTAEIYSNPVRLAEARRNSTDEELVAVGDPRADS
jgi:hypothetical protein